VGATAHCRPGCIADHQRGDTHCALLPAALPLLHPVPGHDEHLLIGVLDDGNRVVVEFDLDGTHGQVALDDLLTILETARAGATP